MLQKFKNATIPIGIINNKNEAQFIGTGFMVYVESDPVKKTGHGFLVTNKHVIRNLDSIFVRFNKIKDDSNNNYLDCPIVLHDKNNSYYTEYPSDDMDIVAIYISLKSLKEQNIEYASFDIYKDLYNLGDMENFNIKEGSLIYTLGFPMNLVEDYKSPLIRLGCISRIENTFKKNPSNYLIDSSIFPGNSGGPVISKPEIYVVDGIVHETEPKIIGIVHSYLPYRDHLYSNQTGSVKMITEENSNIAIVHPADFIRNVIKLEWNRANLDPKFEVNP